MNITLIHFFIFIIAIILYIIPIILLLIISIKLYSYKKLTHKKLILYILLLFIVLLRILSVVWGFLIIYDNPPPNDIYDLYKKMGIFQWFVAPDANIFETHLCKRRDDMYSLLKRISKDINMEKFSDDNITSGTIDPYIDIYSGHAIRWKRNSSGIYIYSIGPDKHNNNMEVIYDPTNGLNSIGDIIIKLEHSKRT